VKRVAAGKFYLVHLPAGFLAISEVCTHRQFSVVYQPERCRFYCPLHGNRYSRTGALTHRGSREKTPPLQTYPISFENGSIVVDTDHSTPRTPEEANVMVSVPATLAEGSGAL
jgi:nitrite reductase/ring-hydroxylating ferredoxin subunit